MIGDRVRVSAWTATYVGRSSWPTAKENPVLCDALGGRVLQVGCALSETVVPLRGLSCLLPLESPWKFYQDEVLGKFFGSVGEALGKLLGGLGRELPREGQKGDSRKGCTLHRQKLI